MWRFLLAVGIALTLASTTSAGGASLENPVEVRISQSGFAGVTGVVYKIDTEGSWSKAEFVNQQTISESTGTLTDEQLAELSALLSENMSSAETPGVEINPKTVELQYGDASFVVILPPGAEVTADSANIGAGGEIVAVAAWLEASIGMSLR